MQGYEFLKEVSGSPNQLVRTAPRPHPSFPHPRLLYNHR